MRLAGIVLVVALAGCATMEDPAPGGGSTPRPPFPAGAAIGEMRTFATIGDPGLPEGIAVANGIVYATLSQDADRQGEVVGFRLADGAQAQRFLVAKAAGDPAVDLSRFLGAAVDGRGRLYVADTAAPRILRIDPATGAQETYGEIPELAPCALVTAGSARCSPTPTDRPSLPNYPAFGPDGSLYVSDTFQATIFRIPPGGGEAELWFQDQRLGEYGANGIAFGPGDARLYIGQTLVESVQPVLTGAPGGAVYTLPASDAPAATELLLFHHYPDQAVDGIAFGASGKLYVTLVGQNRASHGISVLDADGNELAFFPTAQENAERDVQVFFPASVAFDDERRSILFTNQAFDRPEWWAILEAFVDDTALPLHRP